jgi:pimeloyl-ACP methyl ester carboxylesterase
MPGIGDSEGTSDAPEDLNAYQLMPLSSPEYFTATSAALDALQSRGLPDRVVLVGLCSGAYWALHTALADARVAAAIMLNPPSLVWNDQVNATYRSVQRKQMAHSLRSRLIRRATWRKVLAGEISIARCLSLAWDLGVRPALDTCWRALSPPKEYGGDGTRAGATALLDTLRDRGQSGLLMLASDEPLRAELDQSGLLSEFDRWPNIELVLTSWADEAQSGAQSDILDMVGRALDREVERSLHQSTASGPTIRHEA